MLMYVHVSHLVQHVNKIHNIFTLNLEASAKQIMISLCI